MPSWNDYLTSAYHVTGMAYWKHRDLQKAAERERVHDEYLDAMSHAPAMES